MNNANKVLYIVLSIVLILYTLYLTLVSDNDGESFLDYLSNGIFLFIIFFGFSFWLVLEKQMELKSYVFASCVLMLTLPIFSIQTIRSISYNQLNSLEFELNEILIQVIPISLALYFPIRTFFIRQLSFLNRLFPILLLGFNLVFFIFLVNWNRQNISEIQALKNITRKIEINGTILSSELGSPENFSFCATQEYQTTNGKRFYSVYTSLIDNIEYFSSIEEGDSVIKPANSSNGICIKESGERFEVEFVPE